MVRLLIILVFLCTGITGLSQTMTPVEKGSKVEFRIKNFGFTVTGTFHGLAGTIIFDPANVASAKIDVSVDAATIDTDNNTRDGHLRKEDYFDVKNYPRIRFVSAKVENGKRTGDFIVTGRLTIKKVSKDIMFPFTAKPVSNGYILKGDFKINRRDFGVGAGSTISDNLLVCLEVVTRRS